MKRRLESNTEGFFPKKIRQHLLLVDLSLLCDDVMSVVIQYLPTRDWILLSRSCKRFHQWKRDSDKNSCLYNKIMTTTTTKLALISSEEARYVFNICVKDNWAHGRRLLSIENYFNQIDFSNLRSLSLCGSNGSVKITSKLFMNLVSLKTLKIKECSSVDDELFVYCNQLEHVELVKCKKIRGTNFHLLQKLETIAISGCNAIDTSSLIHFNSHQKNLLIDLTLSEKGPRGATLSCLHKDIANMLSKISNRRIAIRLQLDYCKSITAEKLSQIERLKMSILTCWQPLKDLECLTNLVALDLVNCDFETCKDFNLNRLLKLKYLTLSQCNITDEYLNAESLVSLALVSCCKVRKLSPMSKLCEFSAIKCTNLLDEAFEMIPNIAKLTLVRCNLVVGKEFSSLKNLSTAIFVNCMRISMDNIKCIPYLQNLRYTKQNITKQIPSIALNDPKPERKVCTMTKCGVAFIYQNIYECRTCGLVDNLGCCEPCAQICHNGHELVRGQYKYFACDCGGGVSNTDCKCSL